LGREQAKLGLDLPITDLVLAVIALRLDAFVYTSDPHFDGIEGLKQFRPLCLQPAKSCQNNRPVVFSRGRLRTGPNRPQIVVQDPRKPIHDIRSNM
jgi:hypothetical protein